MTAPLDLTVPGSPDRHEFVDHIITAVLAFDAERDNDFDEAAGRFYDTITDVLQRCDYHAGAQLLLATLAARGVQHVANAAGLTLTDLRNRRDECTVGVAGVKAGRSVDLEAACHTCKYAGRYLTAVGNSDTAWAHRLFHMILDDHVFPEVTAALLACAVDGFIACRPDHFERHTCDHHR